jgi:hypothetical protein
MYKPFLEVFDAQLMPQPPFYAAGLAVEITLAIVSVPVVRLFAIAGLSFFVASLFYPVFNCRGVSRHMGYELAWSGWMAILALDPRWFANPLAFLILMAVFRDRALKRASLYSALILVAALSCLVIPAMACGSGAGGPEVSTGIEMGGYLWVASMSMMAIAGFAWRSAVPGNDG